MLKKLKELVIGKPLENEYAGEQRYGVLWGLPILSSDAISSVAYAGQEILLVLVPIIGAAAYGQLTFLSACIIGLLILLTLSYRQTIKHYPNGGGAYTVSKENLGLLAGIVAGTALSIDYVLTVAVSISSGVEQITSAFLFLRPYTVIICITLIVLLMIGNLRGIKESSKFFGIPAYAFIVAIILMIIWGFIKIKNGYVPPTHTFNHVDSLTLLLLLKAFSSGCTALTGIEAVSNAVPNFKEPSVKNARLVLALLSVVIVCLFGGTSYLINQYHILPGDKAVLIQLAEQIFGTGIMFYFVTITTFIILILAANTAFSGFPLLVSVMAKDGYLPRQFSMRGDRLSYSNGIIFLSVIASILVVIFNAKVTSLIGLYAIGVFISFTLSQTGMCKKIIHIKENNWQFKAFINGFGAFVTSIVVVIISVTKFHEGAWIVVILIPILVYFIFKINKHYTNIGNQLRLTQEEISSIDLVNGSYSNRVIVLIEGINRSSIRALKYAKTISDHVVAFNVSIDEESAKKVQERYQLLNTNIPLVFKYSPYRKVVEPLIKFIESAEYGYKKGHIITVILPKFSINNWWEKLLHNHTWIFIERELLKHKHIVIATMPLQLKGK